MNREKRERAAGNISSERGRSTEGRSRNRLAEGLRNTEIKRETDIRNSLGPTEESEQSESSGRETTRGLETEYPSAVSLAGSPSWVRLG